MVQMEELEQVIISRLVTGLDQLSQILADCGPSRYLRRFIEGLSRDDRYLEWYMC